MAHGPIGNFGVAPAPVLHMLGSVKPEAHGMYAYQVRFCLPGASQLFSGGGSLVAGRSAGPFGGVATLAGLRGVLEKCESFFCFFSRDPLAAGRSAGPLCGVATLAGPREDLSLWVFIFSPQGFQRTVGGWSECRSVERRRFACRSAGGSLVFSRHQVHVTGHTLRGGRLTPRGRGAQGC